MIDNYLLNIRGIEAYKRIKEVNKEDTKYYILGKNMSPSLKKEFLEDGFDKAINKENIKKELETTKRTAGSI